MSTGIEEGSTALDRPPLAIGGVALRVRALDRVAEFYRSVIGLGMLRRTADTAELGAGGVTLLTLQHRPDLLPVDPSAAGLYHVAYLLPARADLGAWLNHAAGLGVTLDGAADHLVSEAVYLRDPEGNGIEVYRDRPRAEWSWQDGAVKMANDRLDLAGLRSLPQEGWSGAPEGTRIGHVHLQVGEIAAAEQFYAGVLGFAVTRRWPQALFMSTGGYHHHLAANTWQSAGAGRRDPARAGLHSVTLAASGTSVLDPIAGRLGTDPAAGAADPWGTVIQVTLQNTGAKP